MKRRNLVVVGEHYFEYKVGLTFVGVWEVERGRRGTLKRKGEGGISFVAPYSDEWLDRTRVRGLILRKISN